MKVAFYTLGCKVNQYETDLMMKLFFDKGYEIVDFASDADIYVINSCSVTNMSTRKTRQALSKAKRCGKLVVLVGCYAQEIKGVSDIKNVDIVLGNEEKKEIVKYVEEYLKNPKSIMYKISQIENVKKYVQKDKLNKGINIRESVKIEDGCNNFCSYCIIPYVRGRVRSRNIEDIILEVKGLTKSGVKEIVLVGIEIASFGKDLNEEISFIDVIEKINEISGVERIRLGSIEPRIMTLENIKRLSKISKLCNHFHLSVQTLDNDVLKRMNRHYTREDVFAVAKNIREFIPDSAITCDVIVAFPGETDNEFENTVKGIENINFYESHVFKYSKRKWTKAASMPNQIDGNVADVRSKRLIEISERNKLKFMEKYIGTKQKVLIEEYDKGMLYGYTSNYIKAKIRGDKKLWGQMLEVELQEIEEGLMLGNM